MKTPFRIFLVACFVMIAYDCVAAKPAAFLRFDRGTVYVAIKTDPPMKPGADLTKEVVASVYQDGKQIADTIAGPDRFGADFTILITDSSVLTGDFAPLVVAVHKYPTTSGRNSGFSAAVSSEVVASLDTRSARCYPGFAIVVKAKDQDQVSAYAEDRLQQLFDYMHRVKPAVRVESRTTKIDDPTKLKREIKPITDDDFFGDPVKDDTFFPCLNLTQPPPAGVYDIEFRYPDDALVELRRPFLKTDLVHAGHNSAPLSLDDSKVGKRPLEQNLDLGLQFSSSVADKTIKDEMGKDKIVRERDNKGTLDIRLAPLLNLLAEPDPGENTFKYFTPFLLDARVSTGKINKDTISLNRIVLGSEFEIRHYTNPTTFPTYQRYIFSLRNASDRDFHQAEWKARFEFQPVFSKLNRPLRWRQDAQRSIIDQNPERELKIIPKTSGFGGQFLPLIGVEIGKTWRNKSSFAAIEKTTFIRRFYFGTTLKLDMTSYVRVSATDILYVRGEAKDDRLHNYFLGTVEVPFPSFSLNVANSAFFSFERGGQPPFATPDVNALKFGYRIQWDGWFGKTR
jgi:hypothetical protein